MMNLNRIRSIKTLENIRADLEFFIREDIIKEIYLEEFHYTENDFIDDKEAAIELLEDVNIKIQSLSKSGTAIPS